MLESSSRVTAATVSVRQCEQREKFLLLGPASALSALPPQIGFPQAVNTTVRSPDVGVCLCLRPDQRLLILDAEPEAMRFAASLRAIRTSDCHVLDAGARLVEFAVEGPDCRVLLNAGCSLDLRDAAFPVGTCAQSRCDQIPLLLHRTSRDRFEILVERPLARYFSLWMQRSADNLK